MRPSSPRSLHLFFGDSGSLRWFGRSLHLLSENLGIRHPLKLGDKRNIQSKSNGQGFVGNGDWKNVRKMVWKIIYIYSRYRWYLMYNSMIGNLYTYAHVYIYILYIYIYVWTYIHIFIYTYTHIYIYTCLHAYIFRHIHIYINIYIYAFFFSKIRVCVLLCVNNSWIFDPCLWNLELQTYPTSKMPALKISLPFKGRYVVKLHTIGIKIHCLCFPQKKGLVSIFMASQPTLPNIAPKEIRPY